MVTLQSYILRELLKTFALVQTAIAIVFTMGGGIYNVIAFEGATVSQFAQLLPTLLSIVVTLTMPMAALFTATLVYGRLAADNEFTACRAAGINVHRLFLPVLLLSIFVAAFTTAFANYVIPGQLRTLDRVARANICDFVIAQLKTRGNMRIGERGFYLTAADANVIPRDEMARRGFDTNDHFQFMSVSKPIFVHFEKERVKRLITGKVAVCIFDTSGESVELDAIVDQGQNFEIGSRAVTIDRQRFDVALPIPLPEKPAFASIDRLLQWLDQPWLDTRLGERIDEFLGALVVRRFYDHCREIIAAGRELTLLDELNHRYTLRGESAEPSGNDGRIRVMKARLAVSNPAMEKPVRYEADRIELIGKSSKSGGKIAFVGEIRLRRTADAPVLEFNPRAENPLHPIEKPDVSLDGILLPEHVAAETAAFTRGAVIDPAAPLPIDEFMADKRVGLKAAAAAVQRKVRALLHFRLAFPISALFTVLLAAALGVIFRGARALAAFGLAAIPLAFITILMLMGRQLGEGAATQHIGPWVSWGSLLLMGLADAAVLRLGVRR